LKRISRLHITRTFHAKHAVDHGHEINTFHHGLEFIRAYALLHWFNTFYAHISRSGQYKENEQKEEGLDKDANEDVDDDDVAGRHKQVRVTSRRHHSSVSSKTCVIKSSSSSMTQRSVEKARSVRSLLQAVNKAAMRVNPTDPDAFLSLLSTRVKRLHILINSYSYLYTRLRSQLTNCSHGIG